MRACLIGLAAAVAALGSLTASATTCYLVYDKADVVIFRDIVPPFDLSLTPSPDRAAMRRRGELLLIAEFDKCNAVGFISATTGGTTASVEDIVSQLQPMAGSVTGITQSSSDIAAGAGNTGSTPTYSGANSRTAAARAALVPKSSAR